MASHSLRALGAVLAALGAVLVLPASPATAVVPRDVGLYGIADPTYDGVFRQSLALLGQHAAGVDPDDTALEWLLTQQCGDGGFSSYNPVAPKACPPFDASTFTGGEDTNATAVAVQALLAYGYDDEAAAAVAWLTSVRAGDGGWPYSPGGSSDPNSTGVVLMALSAAGQPVDAQALDSVQALQIGCGTVAEPSLEEDRGGIASPYSGGAPDVLATVQASPGVAGGDLLDPQPPAGGWTDDAAGYVCPFEPADAPELAAWAADWLAAQQADDRVNVGNAPWAILTYLVTGTHHDAAEELYAEVVDALGPAPATAGAQRALAAASAESPGALGLATISAAALGHSADAAGLASRIGPTVTVAAPTPTPKPTASASVSGSASDSASPSPTTTVESTPAATPSGSAAGPELPETGAVHRGVVVGGALLLLAGVGLLLASRPRRGRRVA